MKASSIFISLFFVLLLGACTKSSVSILRNDLAGNWKLVRITGGFAGIDTTPTDDVRISFETNGTYTITTNFAITGTGNYSLAKAPDPNSYYSETIINLVYASGNKTTSGISINKDTLSLSQGCCDQFNYSYIRLK